MTTSSEPLLLLGPDGLPDLAALAAAANALFGLPPGGEDVPTTVLPSVAPGAQPAPAPGGVPSPSSRSQVAPPPSAVTATTPGPGTWVSPAPVPGPVLVPEAPPPASPRPAVPAGSPAPGGFPTPDLGGLLGLVPPAHQEVGSAASPVPMPDGRQLAEVPVVLDGVMGFVASVPFVGTDVSAPTGTDQAPAVGHGDTHVPAPGTQLVPVPEAGVAPVPEAEVALAPEAGLVLPPESLGFSPRLVPVLDPTPAAGFDPHLARADFPILSERVHGKRLVWLDNGATTQKPRAVIERLSRFYERENSNIHRAAHTLAARATDAYEAARDKAARFLNAGSVEEIVFVRGTTEAINLVAQAWGPSNIGEGDEIVITWLEHHANIVPWQQLCARTNAVLRVAPVDDSGQVVLSEYERLLGPRTKLVSFTQVSNALGTVTPAAEMIAAAHRHGIPVLLDGAQSVSHMPVDVQALDVDFFVFSGHKVFGPTGIGVLFAKESILAGMQPWQGGGNMIADVTFDRTVYQPPPARFEAGTGNIADAVGLGAALDYVTRLGRHEIAAYEHDLLGYATEGLCTVPGLCIIGTADEKAGVISFVVDGHTTADIGSALDQHGVAVRAGHHCAQPILRRFGLESTVRASFALYNTREDVDVLVDALHRIVSGRVS